MGKVFKKTANCAGLLPKLAHSMEKEPSPYTSQASVQASSEPRSLHATGEGSVYTAPDTSYVQDFKTVE